MRLFGNRISKPSPRWALWRWFDIVLDGDLYLTRLNIVQTPWFSVKLHWIHRPDPDRDLHDHPWPFAAFVLRGGYEEYASKKPAKDPVGDRRTISWFNSKGTTSGHRISKVKPGTLTLIFSGPRKRKSWGFYVMPAWGSVKYMDWKEYEEVYHG
jgi:hypothetical protein